MIPQNIYAPILKGKAAEFQALLNLDNEIKQGIIPIFEIFPDKKKVDNPMNTALKYIDKIKPNSDIYVDASMVCDIGNMTSGTHPLTYMFNYLRKQHWSAIPVFSTRTSNAYNTEVKKILFKDKKGACIRVYKNIDDVSINDKIEKLILFMEVDPTQIDLIVDLGPLEEKNTEKDYKWTVKAINNLKYLHKWRSLVLAGSSLPMDLSNLKPNDVYEIKRCVWEIWRKLYENKSVDRLPSYSDYGISHPLLLNLDLKTKDGKDAPPNASASIRYTHESIYYIYRGYGTRQLGFEQFFDLSETLINSNEYYGQDHCLGDDFIHRCGTQKKDKGNLKTWRWVGTVHHITVVVEQLRQFFLNFKA